MLRVNDRDFEVCIENLINNKKSFIVEKKRRDRIIIVNGKKVVGLQKNVTIKLPHKKKRSVISLFANVKKSFQRYAQSQEGVIEPIEQLHSPTYRSKKDFSSLDMGEKMYYVDVSHCYWRIAYLLGYITIRMYKSVLTEDKTNDYKLWRNIALSSTIAPKIVTHFEYGELIEEVKEDTSATKIMYQNIRFTAYNIIGEAKEAIGKKGCLNYRIDGMLILPKHLRKVKKVFEKHDLLYEVVECRKVGEYSYLYNGEKIKKF